MSRINTNISSVIAQRILNTQNNRLNLSLQRLSTGLRINTGKDDPAGLIASEMLRSEKTAINSSLTNIARATNVVAVAESGLEEVSRLLIDMEDLVDRSSNETGISEDERDANQREIDNILESINRIASSTELQGRRLLSGDLAYTTSGVSSTQIGQLQINSARIPDNGTRSVVVEVNMAASLAALAYIGGAVTGSARTIEVTGNLGTERLTFASGSALSAIEAAVNQAKYLTGVSASVVSTGVRFTSTAYGSDQFVRVRALSGTFTMSGGLIQDKGRDAIVSVNGQTTNADGLNVSVRSTSFSADLTLTSAFGSVGGGSSTFAVTGGGARFVISPQLDMNSLATLGIDAVTTTALGNAEDGYLYTLGTGSANALNQRNYFASQRIVRDSLAQVATMRARLGSYVKDTLDTTANSLRVQMENVAAAESALRDTDFAEETSNLTRAQILVQSATNVLKMANAAPQNVLALLQ
jgi:flagellin